jgi:Mrp family chromosome partitioning ATPase
MANAGRRGGSKPPPLRGQRNTQTGGFFTSRVSTEEVRTTPGAGAGRRVVTEYPTLIDRPDDRPDAQLTPMPESAAATGPGAAPAGLALPAAAAAAAGGTPVPVTTTPSAPSPAVLPASLAPPPAPARTLIRIAIHKRPDQVDGRLVLVHEPDSERAAAYRVLRHRLSESGGPRAIVVTSAHPGEGKTTCAVNLAIALGECGRARVLLVEANLRTPALGALFGFSPPDCFAQQLARHRERPLEPWSVVEVYWPWLHVAAVKPDGGQGRPLLDAPAFAIAMERLRLAGYDYIVIDTPPVLGSADVNLVEDAADGVLLVGWARHTTARALARAVEQLEPAHILGVALLDV